ncbi:MAG: HPr(Ser) kinase/phosphatase [Tissierellia bacterium]|nr:HPr(Ser) kinase/phosphatase [Tissierellia bacterium]
MEKSVKLHVLAEELGLEQITTSTDYYDIEIANRNVNRPGIQLTGYMDEFPHKRIQIIGNVEYSYYMSLEPKERYERFRGILSYDIPCIIFSYNREITEDIIDLAKYYNKTLLVSKYATTKLIGKLGTALEDYLALEESIHAGLLEVYGSGVLIKGKSSVGKSETGLDLITRGHRLVADDVVEIRKIDDKLYGKSPDNIRHFMEIRGIGILDIRRLYGTGSVKTETSIDLVIELEDWQDKKEYDRLGLDEDYVYILDIKVPKLTVPVKPGRNIAMIIEVATRNNRQKRLGYNSALELTNRLFNEINPDKTKN